ncbi:MAG: gliding motility-associated C-terminal domain-containing protein, partial [Saprospiraceae bacterium]|nr:gliding motility-associated C-terminal domain-containing protein [Saprospiraceae bacterium]
LFKGVCTDTIFAGPVDCSCALSVQVDTALFLCAGDSAVLTATVQGGAQIIEEQWTFASDTVNGLSVTASEGGVYQFTVTDELGCVASATVTVVVATPLTMVYSTLDPSCPGTSDGSITIEQVSGNQGPVLFALDGSNFMVLDTVPFTRSGLAAGGYLIEVIDSLGCTTSVAVELHPRPPIDLDLGPDVEISAGDSVLIMAELDFTPTQINWMPAAGSSLILERWFAPLADLVVTASAIDSFGCEVSDTMHIAVIGEPDEFGLYIPNVFSPNGDQINDWFTVYTQGQIEQLTIFDRWGNLVFERRGFAGGNPTLGWDGRMGNKEVAPGVYVYVAHILQPSLEKLLIAGDVTLIR